MAFRPNYNQARGDRDRAKQQKKQEKLRRREEDAAQRKIDRGEAPDTQDTAETPTGDAPDPAGPVATQ